MEDPNAFLGLYHLYAFCLQFDERGLIFKSEWDSIRSIFKRSAYF